MKTLKWSAIALFFLCIYSSCTKSVNNDSEAAALKQVNKPSSQIQADVAPGLKVTFNPSPAVQGQSVTVTGTFDGSTVKPSCGKLQLRQKIDGQWVSVAGPLDVTSSNDKVTYTFTPTLVGDDVYEFDVHYIVAGCDGFNNAFSGSYFLDVVSVCKGLSISGQVTKAEDQHDGSYLFTVEYTINACGIVYTDLKTQGGLTAWTTDITDLSAGAITRDAGKSDHPNTIITWYEHGALSGNAKTYTVKYRKAWSGSGPVELTGGWSVTATNNGVEVQRAEFDPITYQ